MRRRRPTKKIETKPGFRLELPVLPLEGPIHIIATQQDCNLGERDNPERCTLARAGRREIPGLRGIQVFRSLAWFRFVGHVSPGRPDAATAQELTQFDKTGVFRPGEYIFYPMPIREPSHARRPGVPKRTGKTRKPLAPRGAGNITWIPVTVEGETVKVRL